MELDKGVLEGYVNFMTDLPVELKYNFYYNTLSLAIGKRGTLDKSFVQESKKTLDKFVQDSPPEELKAMQNWAIQQAKLLNEQSALLGKGEDIQINGTEYIKVTNVKADAINLTPEEQKTSFTPQEATLGWKTKYVTRLAKSVTDKAPSGHDVGDAFNRAYAFPAIVVAIHKRATQELAKQEMAR